MTELDLASVGIWSERFADWQQFAAVVGGKPVAVEPRPLAARIPAKDRRRAPLFVRMGIEVMDQACRTAAVDASSIATVFGSSLGDVEITDYLCRTVASEPRSLSPTRFHNSVHNACTGYWSIATGSHYSANAVSAYEYSPAMALLEGAVQASEERVPVLVTFQEPRATHAFESIFPAREPLAVALLLMPKQACAQPLGRLSLKLEHGRRPTGQAAPPIPALAGNFAASMLELLIAAAANDDFAGRLLVSDTSTLAVAYSVLANQASR
jgi:hypothetical protein